LKSAFKKSNKINAEIDAKNLFVNDTENRDLFKQSLPAFTTLNKVLEANKIEQF